MMKLRASEITIAKHYIGQLVHHKLFNYRGVIIDIDANFQLTDEWYQTVAKSKPPKNEPWYHVLVDGVIDSTYVAEQNLEADLSSDKINHPMTHQFFSHFQDGKYINDKTVN